MNSSELLRIVRYGAITLVAVLVFASLAVSLGFFQSGPVPGASPALGARLIAPFKLVDQDGQAVSEADVLGRPAAVFFGFTHCPEVCPTTLASLTATLRRMGSAANKLGVFFVSVDPERDTSDELESYLSAFDPRIRGLTGTPDQIAAFAKPLGVYYARTKVEGGGYTVEHTATMFLLDAQGRFVGSIAYGEAQDAALAKLGNLARTPTS
ncbi:SCO family protein [Thiorhodococcus minor]|uniref:SCO family protein n=1 Tax=Thiorhodococcus minor TaxID=57489 RepID=A0A6M0K457_9GAMM|nr:SCO family protein [Thiorhodococcus minor]NEV64572.1 SCO family protein [Thiorhodococcus minor]